MKVRAKAVLDGEVPARIEPYTRQRFLTAGREYEVHAVHVSEGLTFFQFVDDIGYPAWMPSWIFVITDPTLAPDWICNAIPQEDGSSLFVMGPEFIADDEQSYCAMVELEADQVERFWKRVDELERNENEKDMDCVN